MTAYSRGGSATSLTGSDTSISFVGLREVAADLKRMGVDDTEVKTAMNEVGTIVVEEARSLMPASRTGKLARSLKANKSRSTIKVSVGNNTTVKYAYTFHASQIGRSKGGFTFHVPASSRRTSKGKVPVRAYTAARRIRSNPFLFTAMKNKREQVFKAYTDAMVRLAGSVGNG